MSENGGSQCVSLDTATLERLTTVWRGWTRAEIWRHLDRCSRSMVVEVSVDKRPGS